MAVTIKYVWTGRRVPAKAVHALTALARVRQTTPGRYFHVPDAQTIRSVMAQYYDVYTPAFDNTSDPVLTDPYFDAFGGGVFDSLCFVFVFVFFLCCPTHPNHRRHGVPLFSFYGSLVLLYCLWLSYNIATEQISENSHNFAPQQC